MSDRSCCGGGFPFGGDWIWWIIIIIVIICLCPGIFGGGYGYCKD